MSNQQNDIYYENFVEKCEEMSLDELRELQKLKIEDDIKIAIIKEIVKEKTNN